MSELTVHHDVAREFQGPVTYMRVPKTGRITGTDVLLAERPELIGLYTRAELEARFKVFAERLVTVGRALL